MQHVDAGCVRGARLDAPQDSNQFHACCMDTMPPIFYMNDVSKKIIAFVHNINTAAGRTLVRCHAMGSPHRRYVCVPTLGPSHTARCCRLRTPSTLDPTRCCTCAAMMCRWC